MEEQASDALFAVFDVKLFAFFATIFLVAAMGFALGYFIKTFIINNKKRNIEEKLSEMRVKAQNQISEMIEGAEQRSEKIVADARREAEKTATRAEAAEKKAAERTEKLEKQQSRVDEQREKNDLLSEKLDARSKETETLYQKAEKELESIAGLSKDAALAELKAGIEKEQADTLFSLEQRLERSGKEKITTLPGAQLRSARPR